MTLKYSDILSKTFSKKYIKNIDKLLYVCYTITIKSKENKPQGIQDMDGIPHGTHHQQHEMHQRHRKIIQQRQDV